MLLNLARLDQHEPTYFLQFGQISVQYNWNSTLSALANDTIPTTRKSAVIGGQTSLSGTASQQPQFTFIPVTDEKVAQQLLQPVDPEVLYTLFQQGWPVDQLMRLMVERIEVPQKDGPTIVYFNMPNVPIYPAFLKACAVARELQKDGHLMLEAKKVFSAEVDGVEQDAAPTVQQVIDLDKGGSGGKGGEGSSGDKPSGGGSGGGSKLVWGQLPDGKWSVGSYNLTPIFKLNTGSEETFSRLARTSGYEGTTLSNMRAILTEGFSVEGKPTTNQQTNSSPHLVLRSFLGILAAASQEQTPFDHHVLSNPAELARVPDIERLPVIRLRWDTKAKVLSPIVDLDYRGQYYQVTDAETTEANELSAWNRDVFRLIVQLSSQVSIDISKYPLPTTLQVSP